MYLWAIKILAPNEKKINIIEKTYEADTFMIHNCIIDDDRCFFRAYYLAPYYS